MAFVVIAPVGYAAANYVAKQEADRAVRQATDELRPTITEIERHQAVLSTELRHLKDDINTLSSQNEKILEKLEKLDERLDGR